MDNTSLFRVNDFVWAKLARYPPWPSIIMEPDPFGPPKPRNSHWVYFFGSHNYAWVSERHIKSFHAYQEQYKATNKHASMQEAVEEIEEIIENLARNPNYKIEFVKYIPKERKPRSRKSSESSTDRKRPLKERNAPTPRKRSRSSLSIASEKSYTSRRGILKVNNLNPMTISPKTFGFIACHMCDEGMIKNLIKFGHRVQIWSSSVAMYVELREYASRKNFYLKICRSRRELVKNCDIIYNHQADPEQAKVILEEFGVFDEYDNLLDGKGYVEMSGIDHETSAKHRNLIEKKGGTYLEAMIEGDLIAANSGQLVIIAGGEEPSFEECQSCFKAMAKRSFLIGGIGCAPKLFAILQAMKGIMVSAIAEGFALAHKCGFKLEVIKQIFDDTSMSQDFLNRKTALIVRKKYEEVEEAVHIIQKYLSDVRKLSNATRHPVPLASSANELFKHARRLGFDGYDASCMYHRARY